MRLIKTFVVSHFHCSLNDLLRAREDLTHERDSLLNDIVQLREQLKAAQEKHEKYEKDAQASEARIVEVSLCSYLLYKLNYSFKKSHIMY